jgi:hypothetical protein
MPKAQGFFFCSAFCVLSGMARRAFLQFTARSPWIILRMSAGVHLKRPASFSIGPARMKTRGCFFLKGQRRGLRAMSRIDSLKEVKRGIGFTCRCGKSARITVRGQTLCYECFDEEMRYILDPAGYAERRMRERIRDIGRVAMHRRRSTG